MVLSCFGGGADMSDDEVTKGSRGKRLAVVPVETSGGESDQKSTCGDAIGGKKERKKEMNCRKSFKDKNKGNNAPTKPQSIQEITIVHHVASNLKIKTEPAPLYRILDPVQTQTQTRMSHPGSPEPVNQPALKKVYEENLKKNGYGPCMGLFVLTLALALMVLGGLTVGVICMCVWFSVLYMLRPGTVPEQHGTSEKKLEEIDVNSEEYKKNSEEYKKMVVLRGFLERDKSKSMKETIGDGV